jgi:hypothetical protein
MLRRTPLCRRTPLRARTPMRRRRLRPRRSPQLRDPDYRDWLRQHKCVAPGHGGHRAGGVHHPRHQLGGGAIGGMLKSDDARGLPLCWSAHLCLGSLSGPFRGWTGVQLRAWEDETAASLRAEYEARRDARKK